MFMSVLDQRCDSNCDSCAVFVMPSPSPRLLPELAIRAARECDLPLSVRGGGHDWAGRALCEGIVIDLSGMNAVTVDAANCTARIAGGARAADVAAAADPLGLAAATGSVGASAGGGYGPLGPS